MALHYTLCSFNYPYHTMKYSLLQAKKQTVVLFSFKGNYLLLQNTIKIYYAVIKNTFYSSALLSL